MTTPILRGGFTQNIGGINVGVNYLNDDAGTSVQVETDATDVADGKTFNTNSNPAIPGIGGSDDWTVRLDFSAAGGSGFADEIDKVAFRIHDTDQADWQDIFTINAYETDENLILVTVTPAGDDVIFGDQLVVGHADIASGTGGTAQGDTIEAGASSADHTLVGKDDTGLVTGGSSSDALTGDTGVDPNPADRLTYEDTFDNGGTGWSNSATGDTDPFYGSILG